jgi:cytochrome c biogenesis protein CcmG/thiol:disulfide interchange protein DsbE
MSADTRAPRRLLRRLALACGLLVVGGFIALLAYGVAKQAPDTTIDDGLARAQAVPAPVFEHDVLAAGRVPAPLRRMVRRAAADGRIGLRELRGTPVVLNLWASWCDPCRVEAPVLEQGWRSAGQPGVLFLGLDMQDVPEDARAFLEEFDVTYPNVREGGKETSRRYGATGLPETFFISARGDVVAHVIGALNAQQLRDGVTAAETGRAAPAALGGERRPTR